MKDILLTSLEGDLLIKNGDFLIGESNPQNAHDLINDAPGDWKQYPAVGIPLINYLNANTDEFSITQKVKMVLRADGFNVSKLKLTFNVTQSDLKIDLTGLTR